MLRIALAVIALCRLAPAAETTIDAGSDLAHLTAGERTRLVQEAFARTTQVEWPEAQLTAAAAAALLARSGNPTEVSLAVDDRTRALPAFSGDYWHAVLVVCRAFDLEISRGRSAPTWTQRLVARKDRIVPRVGEPARVEIIAGPVELVPSRGENAHAFAQGPLLLTVRDLESTLTGAADSEIRALEATVDIRLEPRWSPDQIGAARAQWSAVDAGDERALDARFIAAVHQSIFSADGRLHLEPVPAPTAEVRVAGSLQIQMIEPLDVKTKLRPGDTATIRTGVSNLTLRLLGTALAKREMRCVAGLFLLFQEDSLAREPVLMLEEVGGERIGFGMGLTVPLNDHQRALYRELTGAEYEAELTSSLPLGTATLPLAATLDLSTLTKPSLQPETRMLLAMPTRLSWPSGSSTLHDALRRLDVNGDSAALEVDVDASERRDLAGFEGDFWQGVIAIADAFDLTIVPAAAIVAAKNLFSPWAVDRGASIGTEGLSPVAVARGPLRLGRRGQGPPASRRFQACGPLLLELQDTSLESIRRAAETRCRLTTRLLARLEPRIDPDLICEEYAGIASAAVLADGSSVPVRLARETPADAADPAPAEVFLADAAQAHGRVELRGELRVLMCRMARLESPIVADRIAAATIGDEPATLEWRSNAFNQRRALLMLTSRNLDQISAALRVDAVGAQKNGQVTPLSLLYGNGMTGLVESSWTLPEGLSGRQDVAIEARQILLRPSIPFTVDLRQYDATVVSTLPLEADLDLKALSTRAAEPVAGAVEVPTMVRWEAGPVSLQDALRRLQVGGNVAIIDLATDENRRCDLAEFKGTYWQAVLAMADAFDLGILSAQARGTSWARQQELQKMMASDTPVEIVCGTLRFCHRRTDQPPASRRFEACGPLLVECAEASMVTVQRAGGVDRLIRTHLCVRVEPRIDEDVVGRPFANTATAAQLADGSLVPVTAMLAESANAPEPEHTELTLSVAGPVPPHGTVRLRCQLQVLLRRGFHAEAQVTADHPLSLPLGEAPATLLLITKDVGVRSWLQLSSRCVGRLSVALQSPSVGPVELSGNHSIVTAGDDVLARWQLAKPLVDGPYTVTISGQQILAQPCIPFTVELRLQ